jgi:hypothetical protein
MAAFAGKHPLDVIVAANQQPVPSLAGQPSGQPTELQIHRKDASLFVTVTAQG